MVGTTKQLVLPLGKKPRKRHRIGRKLVPLGRRPHPERVGFMPHATRAVHNANHPVHVTIRRVAVGPDFRAELVYSAIRAVIAGAKRNGVRILHYSVQGNHLHLMVEGRSASDLSNQMRTLFSRIAFAVNRVAHRRGRLFRDRHHRHALKTPREVRNALVYILFNDRKHGKHGAAAALERGPRGPRAAVLDACSSARWFQEWSASDRPPSEHLEAASNAPTSRAETWLAAWGWHRGNPALLLRFSESPGATLTQPALDRPSV